MEKCILTTCPNFGVHHSNISDTIGYINNPYTDMKGIYIPVYMYKGHIVYSGGMDGDGPIDRAIMDKIVYNFSGMSWCQHYLSVTKENYGVIIFVFSKNDTLEIKPLNDNGLQLWKGDLGQKYQLRIRMDRGVNLPTINFWNTLGELACVSDTSTDPPFFDHINYDSLFNSK